MRASAVSRSVLLSYEPVGMNTITSALHGMCARIVDVPELGSVFVRRLTAGPSSPVHSDFRLHLVRPCRHEDGPRGDLCSGPAASTPDSVRAPRSYAKIGQNEGVHVADLVSLIGKLAGPVVQRLILAPRVALRVASVLKREDGRRVSLLPIVRVLQNGDVLSSFRAVGPHSSNARLALSSLFDVTRGLALSDDRILSVIYSSYLQTASPSVAADLVGLRTDINVRSSASDVASQIGSSEARILDAITATQTDVATFPYKLRAIPKLLSVEAAALQMRWPGIARAVAAIEESAEPAILLSTWTEENFAAVLEAPPRALAWLGEFSELLGSTDTAAAYYAKAIRDGVAPSGYWRVREIQCRQAWDRDRSAAYIEAVTPHAWATAALAQLRGAEGLPNDWIEQWQPSDPGERAQRDLVEVRMASGRGDWTSAETAGRRLFEATDLPSAGLLAIEAILNRELASGRPSSSASLSDALQLALQVRDRCRDLRLPSGEAVARAMYIARVLGDGERALRLGLPLPDGDALAAEAKSEPVRLELADHSALAGRAERTIELLEGVRNDGRKNAILGYLEEALGHNIAAIFRWHQALSKEVDIRRQATTLWQLALQGVSHPLLTDISKHDQELGEDLALSARLVRDPETAIPEARSAALTNRRIAFSLLEFFSRTNRKSDEEHLALAAAEQYDDADLWLKAARIAASESRATDTLARADRALASAPELWGGAVEVHVLRMNASAQLSDWDAAAKSAESLRRTVPDNKSFSWALATTRFRAGDYEESFKAWVEAGRPEPIERDHAAVWLELRRRVGSDLGDVNQAIKFIAAWPEDEGLRAAFIVTFMSENLLEDELEMYQAAFAAYWNDFPEGGTIRRLDLDADRLLESFNEILGPAPDLRDLFAQVATGALPLGMVGSVRHRSYAETLVLWGSAARQSLRVEQTDEQAVQRAKNLGCVADLSALFALSVLDTAVAAALFGSLPRVVVTSKQYRDAVDSEYAVRTQTGLSMSPVGNGGEYVPVTTPDSDLQLAKDRAQRIVEWARASTRVPVTTVEALDEIATSALADEAWPTALDKALITRQPFWSDDATLRTIARSRGLDAFSTGALIVDLLEEGKLDPQLVDIGLAQLTSAGFVDVPFSQRSFALAIQLDAHLPRGTAQSLRYSRHMAQPEVQARLPLLFEALEACKNDADATSAWCFAMADWMIRLAEDRAGSESNLRVLLAALLRMTWLEASSFAFIVKGTLSAIVETRLSDESIVDAVAERYLDEVRAFDPTVAFAWVNSLCTLIDQALRQRIIERIFTTK